MAFIKGAGEVSYIVTEEVGSGIDRIKCTCPDFENRQIDCKHIHFYRMKVKDDRQACPYEGDCYRTNMEHLLEFKHPANHKPKPQPDLQ